MAKLPIYIICLLGLCHFNLLAQPGPGMEIASQIKSQADPMKVGTELYQIEVAARNAIQILGTYHQDIKIHDYVSYMKNDTVNVVFWKEDADWYLVVAVISFPKPVSIDNYEVKTKSRLPEKDELTHIRIKEDVQKSINLPFFKRYQNSFLQPIIFSTDTTYEVHLINVPNLSTSILFGNDYLITYDKTGKQIEKRALDPNLVAVPSVIELKKKGENYTSHKHTKNATSEVTPTDICILLLYEPYVNWEEHRIETETSISTFKFGGGGLIVQQKK